MPLPTTIRATVAAATIDKVGRLFNGSSTDVLNELLQNARRAGASRIEIERADLAGQPSLVVRDDGRGIDDPQSLVALGLSDWSDATRASEDPAGMGVFAMAGLRVEYRSFSSATGQGWRAVIEADCWSGKREIVVEPFEMPSGTEVVIDVPDGWDCGLERAVASVARHYPIPVWFNGTECARRDWLADALRIEHWRGSRIGVFHDVWRTMEPTLNFHGVTVPLTLPTLREVGRGRRWMARIDIGDTPELQLVLPARKEVVHTPFIGDLLQACEVAIFRAVAAGGPHRLPFVDRQRALALGVTLDEADPVLHAWSATSADNYGRETGEAVRRPMIRMGSWEAPVEQTAQRALGLLDDCGLILVSEEREFEGYSWYDELEQVTDLRIRARRGEQEILFSRDWEQSDIGSGRVDEIRVELEVETPGGAKRIELFPTDVALLPVEVYGSDLDNIVLLVAPDAAVGVSALADLLADAAFCPSDDRESDSYDTQRGYFEREALQLARTHLQGEDAATTGWALDRINDHIRWLVPEGRQLLMAASRDRAIAVFADEPASCADAEAFASLIHALTQIDADELPLALDALSNIRSAVIAWRHDLLAQAAAAAAALTDGIRS